MPRVNAKQLAKSRNMYPFVSETVQGASGQTKTLSLDCRVSLVKAAGASTNTFSLPDGEVVGQEKIVILTAKASTGAGLLTATSLATSDISLSAVNDSAVLAWSGTDWVPVSGLSLSSPTAPDSEDVTGVAGDAVALGSEDISNLSIVGETDNEFSLPDGDFPGQRKLLVVADKAGAGNATITGSGMTYFALDAEDEFAELVWLTGSSPAWHRIIPAVA